MSRPTNKLKSREALALRTPGLHSDGQGLYLRIDQAGARSWVLIFHQRGRRREMGLGSIENVGLARARELATEAREAVRRGEDPIAARRAARTPIEVQTFEKVAAVLLDELEKGWKSPKQRPQWEASLKTHAARIWRSDIAKVDTEMVLEALQPIWTSLPETAQRVRGRLERVLDAAKVRGLRSGENPARWNGHLALLLTALRPAKIHHPAMPYAEVPAFVEVLNGKIGVAAMAMRFLILTACRSGEVRGARWDEIAGDTWIIPAARMKAKKEHRVPLSRPARAILDAIPHEVRRELIFHGPTGAALSDTGLTKALRNNGQAEATAHGFRSSFRDWAGDCTAYQRELIEEALAHSVGNATERAYRRSTALEKRRDLMNAWGDYCTGVTASNIHQLRA